jgi:hypothetical protein
MKPAKMITAPTSRYEKNQGELDGMSKIIIIGDSHTSCYASDLSQKLNNLCQITGYVKPNADVVQLIDTAKEEVSKLTKTDILIFWGSANDIDRKISGKGLARLVNF